MFKGVSGKVSFAKEDRFAVLESDVGAASAALRKLPKLAVPTSVVTVDTEEQVLVADIVTPRAPLRGPVYFLHPLPLPHFPDAQRGYDVLDAELEIVVVNPVTEQPSVVTVVEGVHVVVEMVEPPVVFEVGTHLVVTCSAVCVVQDEVDEEVSEEVLEVFELDSLVDESSSVLLSLSLESLFLVSLSRFVFSVVRFSTVLSIASTLLVLTLSVASSRPLSMHDRDPVISPKRLLNALLFLFEPHPFEEDSVPISEMNPSTWLLTSLILFKVFDFFEVGSFFHDLRMGIKAASSVKTEDALDVACEVAIVVVTGASVIGVDAAVSEMTGTFSVVPDTTAVTIWTAGASEMVLVLGCGEAFEEAPLLLLLPDASEDFVLSRSEDLEVERSEVEASCPLDVSEDVALAASC